MNHDDTSHATQAQTQGADTGWDFASLYGFDPNSQLGNMPKGCLVADVFGNLYGVTNVGGLTDGDPSGHGVVFRLSPSEYSPICTSYTYSVLHHFNGVDGARPVGGLLASDGGRTFYGTTAGGGVGGNGVVFKLSLSGDGSAHYSVLYNFEPMHLPPTSPATNPDGAAPTARLAIDAHGVLYGTTSAGGANGGGTAFMLAPDKAAYVFTKLHDFGPATRHDDNTGGLTLDQDGNLYGLKQLGGANSAGEIFALFRSPLSGYVYDSLYSFPMSMQTAAMPTGDLAIDARGRLYGTTDSGGTNWSGSVFRLDPTASPLQLDTLHDFNITASGVACPLAGVVLDDAGNIFGTASDSDANGAVFMLKNNGDGSYTYSTLFDFVHSKSQGNSPENNLIFDGFGNLCGTTVEGGESDGGTVFKLIDMRTAKGAAVMEDGVVLGVTMIIGGQGYVSPPSVRFDAPGIGMTAQGVAVLTDGAVTSVQMTNSGSGYDFVPQVYFSSP
jgi:uncharacterized repeat protein (TIGR03803 family)